MERVTGIGGVFLRARDPVALEVLDHRADIQLGDRVALNPPHLPVVERHELHRGKYELVRRSREV